MRIWVWWRPIEGFVPEECNYPAVRRLLINVILFIAAYCGRSYMYSGDITIAMEPWTFRSESNKHGSTKNTSISLRLLVAIQRCRFQLLCSVLRRDALF